MRVMLSALLSVCFVADTCAQDQPQATTLLGISCKDDFYVIAAGVAGAAFGTVVTRGRHNLATVIVEGVSEKLAEKYAPQLCEVMAGLTSASPPPSFKELPPTKHPPGPCSDGKFYSLGQRTCVELKVAAPCGGGETYNSMSGKCVPWGSQAARVVCEDNKILVDGKCMRLATNPICSSTEIYSALQKKCVPRDQTISSSKRCGADEVRMFDTCIPLRQLN